MTAATRKTATASAHESATAQTPADARADEERGSRIILYTCPWQERSSGWHPCGVAAKALEKAGYSYQIKEVRGQLSMPWTWLSRRRDRAHVRSLSGQNGVPILLLANGSVIAGSSRIARWAKEHPVPRGAEE